ncbi:MAG: endonuclease/exonuclease/phosphatase family protein [Verrucomicrobium sp.]|nr:endonuclease/exonuclease/phosphatase family protein [Verrucomicrobium sp.]
MQIARFKLSVFAILLAMSPLAASAANFGTFNLRYDNPGDVAKGHAWTDRAPVIAGILRFHDFDVFGTQEGLPHQMTDLHALLPEHDLVSYGRNDGANEGEHVAIFYKKDKYRKLESGRFWLSQTPEAASVGWDAMFPRICTWVKLEETATGKSLCFFNVHFDHRGTQAKVESARLLLAQIKKIAGELPVALVGDFNLDQNTDGYKQLHDDSLLADAYETAEVRFALTGTVNRFDPGYQTDTRIDHVFLSSQFKVKRYGVLTDTYRSAVGETDENGNDKAKAHVAKVPSDHFPVLVGVE